MIALTAVNHNHIKRYYTTLSQTCHLIPHKIDYFNYTCVLTKENVLLHQDVFSNLKQQSV